MADSDNDSGGNNNHNTELSPREQDRFLPIANVSRIMKKALPANAKISKDAKETVQECVSEFIKKKTINGDDLLWAMTTLGFEEYVEPLKIYLQKFREMEGEKSTMTGRPGEKDGSGGSGGGGGNGGSVNSGNNSGGYSGSAMYGGLQGSMNPVMMGHHQQGPIYGSGSYQHMVVGIGGGGSSKGISGSSALDGGGGRVR
ncbi:hypothetical protein MKW92_049410 [Papaver armeniacum]|nr:hypothetical protein MKW92_049410 [Papaver armeniacum]